MHAGMKRLLAFAAVLALAACASTTPSDHPAPAQPAAAKDCHCDDDSAENLRGFAFKGRIAAVLADQGEWRVSSGEIPGAMPAGTHEFKVAPDVLSAVQPGREILARIEWRNDAWWIFDVRLLIPLHAVP
jgi:hypothetical protein